MEGFPFLENKKDFEVKLVTERIRDNHNEYYYRTNASFMIENYKRTIQGSPRLTRRGAKKSALKQVKRFLNENDKHFKEIDYVRI